MRPAPVDLGALTNLLAKSKKVMDVTQQKSPIVSKHTSNVNESYGSGGYDERDEREPNYPDMSAYTQKPIEPLQNYSPEHIMASKLPQNVKEAMIKKPIAKVSNFASVGLSEEQILAINPNAKINKGPIQEQSQPLQSQPQYRQQSDSDMITISRSELKEIMNETLVNFLKNNYEKMLTEKAITNTINLLIKEGKITTKKKV